MATLRKSTLQSKKSGSQSKRAPVVSGKKDDPKILMLAGEHSGDLLGGELIRELKKNFSDLETFGVGGERMIEEGFTSIESMEELSIIGFSAILFKYGFLKKLIGRLIDVAVERNCTHAVLIDYPGFNLRLAKELKKLGITVVFYVSPQLWAWKFDRIYTIRDNIDLMLVLFPFEKEIYDRYGVPCEFVGHPLAVRLREKIRKETLLPDPEDKTHFHSTITLMPGSRSGEIRRILNDLLETAGRLSDHYETEKKKIRFLLPNINQKEEVYILERIELVKTKYPNLKIEYLFDRSLRAIEASDLVLVTSGTATLEVAYFEKPMVILYKVSMFTYVIGSLFIRTPHIGLVNILSGKEICRELVQAECTPTHIAEESILLLDNKKYRSKTIEDVSKVKEALGNENSSRHASREITKLIKGIPKKAGQETTVEPI
ncbi:lipid-A-disaccharide synthase [Leptospira alstonii]|uniref:Lipid-A-disaccharide synthase n=2 Tax=Leptospira alstonii TaxID=28452 RepID=M6CIY7_9LEPT|nr:lipid-A-disaccharide synthase [Leptospira alstonii]EMJ90586.1 lipid-A-disaccharide synthase [Leptospira alstonii serovar Sichuan str. 79601]EQA82100.1 lipid-A-disaccharide synthase [Leptospira alstonii serovar Pingchang str. 80-412]